MFSVSPTERSIALCYHRESSRGIIFKTWMQAAAAFWLTSSFTDQEQDVLLARQAQLAWAGSGHHLQPGPWKTGQAWGLILAPGLGGGDQRPGSFPGTFPDARLSSCLAPACPSGLASLWCPLAWKQEWWGTEAAVSTASQGVAQKFCRNNRGQCAECQRLLGLLSLF